MRESSLTLVAFVLTVCLLAPVGVRAQGNYATITGAVIDPARAAVPGATVEATNLATNYRYTAVSNESGIYTLPPVLPGRYRVKVSAAGFKELVVEDIEVRVQDVRRVDARLEVGAVETRIEVKGGLGLIETETARVASSVDRDVIDRVAIGRALRIMVNLSSVGMMGGGGLRLGGSREAQEWSSVDGISINGTGTGSFGSTGNKSETFEVVRLDGINNSAEYGTVAHVTVTTKSGSNELHGKVYDYYSSGNWQARNPFSPAAPRGVSHTMTFQGGGPVYLPRIYNGRNRTFFFASLESLQRGSQTLQATIRSTVPAAKWRGGDFSGFATTIRDPLTSQAFPGNRIPAERLNPVAVALQERFYPLPNVGDPDVFQGNNFLTVLNLQGGRVNDQQKVARIDHRVSNSGFLFIRGSYYRPCCLRGFESSLPTVGQLYNNQRFWSWAVSYTQTVRSNIISEFSVGGNNRAQKMWGAVRGLPLVRQLGLVGLAPNLPDIRGVPNLSFAGVGFTSVTQTAFDDRNNFNSMGQIRETVSWKKGRHTVKAGYYGVRVVNGSGGQNGALFGSMQFSNRYTGYPWSDFLLGLPSTVSRASVLPHRYNLAWRQDWFIADNFKVTPRVTLDLGLRYEYHPSRANKLGGPRGAAFDVSTGKLVIADGSSGQVSPFFPGTYVGLIEASQAGYDPTRLIRPDKNNFAPRFGIAYRPWGNNTVFRGGFGIYYDVKGQDVSSVGAPYFINEPSYTNPSPTPTVVLPRVFPDSVAGPATVSLGAAYNPATTIPYTMQYSVTAEHQRWKQAFRATYVGTAGRQMVYGANINQPLADTRSFIEKPRLFPQYPAITYWTNGGRSQYNGLSTEVRSARARALTYQFAWTWQRDINEPYNTLDMVGNYGTGNPPTSEYFYNRRRERSVQDASASLPTHRVTGHVIYELPFGKGRRWAPSSRLVDRAIGGWEISNVYLYHSGEFITPYWTGADPTGTAFTGSATPATLTIRPDCLRNPNISNPTRDAWFDASAFAAPRPGAFGSCSGGVIVGPHQLRLSAVLAKQFSLYHEGRVRLRTELRMDNWPNVTNLGRPQYIVSNTATVGKITGIKSGTESGVQDGEGMRKLTLGLRIEW